MSDAVYLRRVMLGAAAAICVGVPAELALAGHWQSPIQLVPFVACGVGAVGVAFAGRGAPTPGWVRWAMGFVALSAVFGVWEHIEHNAAFVAEIQPNATRATIAQGALTGANPVLAPLILLLVAVFGAALVPERGGDPDPDGPE